MLNKENGIGDVISPGFPGMFYLSNPTYQDAQTHSPNNHVHSHQEEYNTESLEWHFPHELDRHLLVELP